MQLARWIKVTFWTLGSLVLGALGSGLWEIGLKPGGQWFARAILTAATLGSTSLKDEIYRKAAKGLHDEAALSVLVLFLFWGTVVLGWLVAQNFRNMRDSIRELEILERRLDNLRSPHPEKILEEAAEESDASIGHRISGTVRRAKKLRIVFLYITIVLFATNVGAQLIVVLNITEANNAYTFFRQSMAICRPYVSDQEAEMINSQFASVNDRADYLTIIHELQQIAASHQRKLPSFSPW